MLQSKAVLSLTVDLLAHGGFSHLKDEKISALHHLILRLQEPLTNVQQNLLLAFWHSADADNIPAALLHRCNAVLYQMGMQPMEAFAEEMDMY